MLPFGTVTHTPLTTIPVDGREVRVTLHTAHDGIELVGRLFFAEQGWTNNGIPDSGVLSGRTLYDVELLAKVRYMNQVAVSVRTGLLDGEAASQELDLTEGQMQALIRHVRHLAGIEG